MNEADGEVHFFVVQTDDLQMSRTPPSSTPQESNPDTACMCEREKGTGEKGSLVSTAVIKMGI